MERSVRSTPEGDRLVIFSLSLSLPIVPSLHLPFRTDSSSLLMCCFFCVVTSTAAAAAAAAAAAVVLLPPPVTDVVVSKCLANRWSRAVFIRVMEHRF